MNHLEERNLVNSLLSNERFSFLKQKKNLIDYDISNISKWLNLKSLVKENELNERLKYEKIDKNDFNLGIKKLDDNEKDFLLNYIKKMDWFQYFEKLMCTFEEVDNNAHKNGIYEEIDMSYVIRPFIYTLEKNIYSTIKSLKNFNVSENAIKQILNTYTTKLFMFFNKVFIIEMNIAKKNFGLKGNTSEERFIYFIKNFFRTKEQLLKFYYTYPVLTRIVTIKTKFISDFIADAFKHLDINYKEIQTLYDNEKLELIEEASVSEGDSHEKSKSVIIFTFSNNIKLVYKPRDLRVIKAYNSFVDCINESSALLDVAKINGLYYENYSFEKFIKYEQCKSEQEIKNYYKRFGHIVAIAHVLCANDLHSENLIAASQYPTIIDLETIIQADSQLYISKKERAGAVIKHDMFVNSICFTSLLPKLAFNNKNGKVIDISALNGKSDKLPFKVLSPININTDEYKLDYQNHIIQASNNIPMLNGKLVYFNNYKKEIYSGFEEMMNVFMDSKSKLIGKNGKINVFKGCIVRNVLKSTQLYMNLLNYSNHPNYAQYMLSREKLIENLWSYPYKNKEVIKYEYNDMMYDDIPVFFSYTDSKNIISSTKEIIKDYFPQSGLSKVLQRIKNLDVEEIEKQKSILKVRLGQYNEVVDNLKGNMECSYKIDFNINILGEIKEIINFIISKGVYSEQGNQISWADIIMNKQNPNIWEEGSLDCGIYNGLSGVALLFLEFYNISKEHKYFEIYEKTIISAIREADFDNNMSAYGGKVSILFPIIREIQKTGKSNFSYYINEIKSFIKENINNFQELDWLSGYSGVIALMLNIYEVLNDKECLDIAIQLGYKICHNIDIKNFNIIGYAHGCSGIAIALSRLYNYCCNELFINKAYKLIEKERMLIKDNNYKINSKWCSGYTGIGLSRLELYKKYNDSTMLDEIEYSVNIIENSIKKDDCLCHGNMADMELLNQYIKLINNKHDLLNKKLSNIYLKKIDNGKYSIRQVPQFISVSLFTGLSGIGYQLLRLYNSDKVSNVLTFELGK